MQKLSYVLAVVLLASSSVAFRTFPYFAPTARVQTLVTTNAKHCASTEMKSNAAAAIVATVLGINLLTGNVVSAVSFESSSIMISDQIKTFDMSLPSYDKISDARASLAAVEDREAKTSQKNYKSRNGRVFATKWQCLRCHERQFWQLPFRSQENEQSRAKCCSRG